jgi:hypothetical protein
LSTAIPFKIGSTIALAWRLLRQHWRKLVWLYVVFLLVPHVLLGELSDTEREPLFGFFSGPIGNEVGLAARLTGYIWEIPTALFYATALASLMMPDQRPWRGAARAFLTTGLALVAPAALQAVLLSLASQRYTLSLPVPVIAFALLGYLLFGMLAILFFVACASATTRFSPTGSISHSFKLVRPYWFRVLVLAGILAIFALLSQFGETLLLQNFQTPDGTAVDWLTTVLQEIVRTGYRLFTVALEVAAFQSLTLFRDGPPPAVTASVFD